LLQFNKWLKNTFFGNTKGRPIASPVKRNSFLNLIKNIILSVRCQYKYEVLSVVLIYLSMEHNSFNKASK